MCRRQGGRTQLDAGLLRSARRSQKGGRKGGRGSGLGVSVKLCVLVVALCVAFAVCESKKKKNTLPFYLLVYIKEVFWGLQSVLTLFRRKQHLENFKNVRRHCGPTRLDRG